MPALFVCDACGVLLAEHPLHLAAENRVALVLARLKRPRILQE